MITRIMKAYGHSAPQVESDMSLLWQAITNIFQKSVSSALLKGDELLAEEALSQAVALEATHGVDTHPLIYSAAHPGVDLSKLSNTELSIPEKPGDRSTLAGEVCLLARKLCGGVPVNVLEIGGGMGFSGVIFRRWGAASYTDIDLPTMAAMAAFFVARVCEPQNIGLYSEADANSKFARFLPSTDCRAAFDRKYDVVINVNSFPEIRVSSQDTYLKLIADTLKPDGFFLSVNHESNIPDHRSVPNAMRTQNRLFLTGRRCSPILHGYFDEVYQLNKL